MKKEILKSLFVILPFAMGCVSVRHQSAEESASTALAGHYYRGDGLGYNVGLDLQADRSYSAIWRGCLGVYGTAAGKWSVHDKVILLQPTNETGAMRGHLRELEVVQTQDKVVLVATNDRERYDQDGVSRGSCFQIQE